MGTRTHLICSNPTCNFKTGDTASKYCSKCGNPNLLRGCSNPDCNEGFTEETLMFCSRCGKRIK